MSDLLLNDQERERREEMRQLRDLGIDPYPAPMFPVNAKSAEVVRKFIEEGYPAGTYTGLQFAGRITAKRIMGKASFAVLEDSTGKLQLYISRDQVCPGEDKSFYNEVFKRLISLGDIIGVKGYMFQTQTGEATLHVEEMKLLSKSLRPIIFRKETEDGKLYDTLTDTETRYRQRYLDLVIHPEVREVFTKRSMIISTMRDFLVLRGFLEVETPVLQPVYGGAAARPFTTHHNTLDTTLYLRIANELYLKRLIVGGFEGVFEFAKDFRNEGMSRFHNPEFTMMELYVAYKDYLWMMDFMEEMTESVANRVTGSSKVKVGEKEINFGRPWKRYTMYGAIQEFTGIDISGKDENELMKVCTELKIPADASMGRGKLIDEIFGAKVEPFLLDPTFITDYPLEMSPLAKKHRDKPGLVERFECICNGKEICNAFSELNDPVDQRERFREQVELGKRGDEEAMVLDEDFLRALEYGMPPTAGLGVGIDRLAMILTNQNSIQDVLFFPQMKPEKKAEMSSDDEYRDAGIPEEWIPLVKKAGILTIPELKSANPGKLFNDICGLNKKLKLGLKAPAKDHVESWCS